MPDGVDWRSIKQLLLHESEPIVRALLAENEAKGDALSAIGYVFEFGRGQLCFDACANTARNAKESLAEHLAEWPDASGDEVRWNSGDFDYSGGVQDRFGDWSTALWDELSRLDRLAADKSQSKAVHDEMAEICCEILAELANRGVLGDWSIIDFNVAALLDDIELVKQRDAHIRDLIKSSAEPRSSPDRPGK